AKVNLVPAEPDASDGGCGDRASLFVSTQARVRRKDTEAFHFAGRRLYAGRVANRPAQHLIATADADERRAAAMLLENPIREPDVAEPQEIGDGVLASGKDDEVVGIGRRRGDPVRPRQQTEIGGVREV